MRLLGTKTPRWVVNNKYAITSAVCITILLIAYAVMLVLGERNRELAAECGFDCPNFMYYHDGGDATFLMFVFAPLWLGLLATAVFSSLAQVWVMVDRRKKVNVE